MKLGEEIPMAARGCSLFSMGLGEHLRIMTTSVCENQIKEEEQGRNKNKQTTN